MTPPAASLELRHGAVSVSFVLDKPPNARWPLFVSKRPRPVKFEGRIDHPIPPNDCVALDVDAGGAILFSGTDHPHFRRTLDSKFYSIILLHYCPYDGCDDDPTPGASFF